MRWTALALALLTQGCVLAIKGGSAPVAFTSEPPGATVVVDQTARRSTQTVDTTCVTPCQIKVKRSEKPTPYEVTLAGHETLNAEMVQAEDWNVALLLPSLFDGLLFIPGIIDIGERVGWDPPESVHLVLPAVGSGAPRAIVKR